MHEAIPANSGRSITKTSTSSKRSTKSREEPRSQTVLDNAFFSCLCDKIAVPRKLKHADGNSYDRNAS